jgi:hypothetical protein
VDSMGYSSAVRIRRRSTARWDLLSSRRHQARTSFGFFDSALANRLRSFTVF